MNDDKISKSAVVIEMGGKQHLAFSGDQITVEKLNNKEGETVKTNDLLTGKELLFKVIAHKLGKKVNGLKFKNKVRYLKRYGHRQQLTVIEEIVEVAKVAPIKKAEEKTVTKPVKKTATAKKVATEKSDAKK
jgi:large subunit ribosomal protein L21